MPLRPNRCIFVVFQISKHRMTKYYKLVVFVLLLLLRIYQLQVCETKCTCIALPVCTLVCQKQLLVSHFFIFACHSMVWLYLFIHEHYFLCTEIQIYLLTERARKYQLLAFVCLQNWVLLLCLHFLHWQVPQDVQLNCGRSICIY